MRIDREAICRRTSQKLAAAAPRLGQTRAVIGFDGFVDQIISVVDKRFDQQRYDAVRTIEQFGRKVLAAAGTSSNCELVIRQTKLGGNGPIMANALAALGLSVTYIGSVGYPAVDPVFGELSRRANVVGIAAPAHTDALEFDDGKLMLNKPQSLGEVTWENLLERAGIAKLRRWLEESTLIGMVNWTMLPYLSAIWSNMLEHIVPGMEWAGKQLFVDLADPQKRTTADLREALELLRSFQQHVDVTLGLNLNEASQAAGVLGIAIPGDAEARIEQTAAAIRRELDLGCVVVHPRHGAAAATAQATAAFGGPFVRQPRISTGAGDHFNAGFCLGRILGFDLHECLCAGVATSGHYVRTASSPTATELAGFVADLPAPEG